jgi:hypothetical protein
MAEIFTFPVREPTILAPTRHCDKYRSAMRQTYILFLGVLSLLTFSGNVRGEDNPEADVPKGPDSEVAQVGPMVKIVHRYPLWIVPPEHIDFSLKTWGPSWYAWAEVDINCAPEGIFVPKRYWLGAFSTDAGPGECKPLIKKYNQIIADAMQKGQLLLVEENQHFNDEDVGLVPVLPPTGKDIETDIKNATKERDRLKNAKEMGFLMSILEKHKIVEQLLPNLKLRRALAKKFYALAIDKANSNLTCIRSRDVSTAELNEINNQSERLSELYDEIRLLVSQVEFARPRK